MTSKLGQKSDPAKYLAKAKTWIVGTMLASAGLSATIAFGLVKLI